MTETLWWALLAAYALIVLRWLWGHVEFARVVRRSLLVPITARDSASPAPRVTVIIAAHNEAETIGHCLEGVLAQDYPDLQVIVANDRSSDATGEIARAVARAHPNVQCVEVTELPDGWLGKTHALAVAAPRAAGEYLLFTDSDVHWHPTTLATVVELAQRERLDFLSLWPKVIVVSFWERFLLPACGWVLSLWYPNARPGDVEATPVFANGQFLLVRREAYERIGGHAAVRDEMAEDVALARRAHAAGLRRYLGLGVNLFHTRMYENLRQIVRGWTRIYIGVLQAPWKLVASIGVLLLGTLPPFAVLTAAAVWISGGGELRALGVAWLAAAGVHLAAMYTLVHRHFHLVFEGKAHVLTFPLALLGVIALLLYCLLLIAGIGTIRWGNVCYQVRGSRAVRSRRVPD